MNHGSRKSFKQTVYLIIITLILSSVLTAQERHFTLKNTQLISIKSEQTGRAYELIIILPGNYNNQPDKHYPVLYFMDAYWDTPLLASIQGQLVYDNAIPEMIMVGFSYPGENANYGDLRARDLTPAKVISENPFSGDAPKFLEFIEVADHFWFGMDDVVADRVADFFERFLVKNSG